MGTYLPSITLHGLGSVISLLNGNSTTPGNSSSLKNMFGFSRSDASFKLLSYLGYGNIIHTLPPSANRWWSTSLTYTSSSSYTQAFISNSVVNLFPLLTYQKIYQDFFRWSQWENANPSSYNVDYFSGVSPSLIPSSMLLRILITGNPIQCLTSNIAIGTRIC